jgi:hypothetical protein
MTERPTFDPPAASTLRPPGDGECRFCGSTPAAHVSLQSLLSIAIIYRVSTVQGWMCRACGLAVFRSQNSRTLAGCWWGLGIIGAPILLIANRVKLGRVLRLAPPQPTPHVAAQVSAPLDPGKAVLLRGSGIFALAMCALILLVIGVGALALASP